VITDLDRDDFARMEHLNLVRETTGVFINVAERAQDLSARRQESGRVTFSGENFVPLGQQWIEGFHRLREQLSAAKFRARFQT